jgi:hypothetical protein
MLILECSPVDGEPGPCDAARELTAGGRVVRRFCGSVEKGEVGADGANGDGGPEDMKPVSLAPCAADRVGTLAAISIDCLREAYPAAGCGIVVLEDAATRRRIRAAK